jgi:RNA polymerase sigma factor (sigma-70 family)
MPAERAPSSSAPAPSRLPVAEPIDDLYAYAGLLRSLAKRKFRIPHADIEPLVQDAFVAYLTDPSGIRNVRGYLVGTMCNRCRNYWRRQVRERSIFGEMSADYQHVDDTTLAEIADRLALQATLAQLQPRCRDVLTRRYLQHETIELIAEGFETSAAYVHKMLHLCRKRAIEIFRELTRTA